MSICSSPLRINGDTVDGLNPALPRIRNRTIIPIAFRALKVMQDLYHQQ